ncbi:RpiR family transcriptional regulator [Trichococcus patagoniensis]|uniref:RpiR family transcriptional regulator n=1 Tax=Trichococcus patagoniensis TaxID=382641 RepID=A0A2T5IQS8_9LACT|nr:MurR/RpiR family transcriptional regulator [Trichococcus patagoniensis]PTQ86181.1 RpiR family transcriptional regulator [Trichococcus patagoniensis]
MKLIQKIEDYTILYKDSRSQIAEFLIHNKDDLNNYSMNDISKQTYSSKTTLVRFAKSLGFSGWKELIKTLIEEIRYEETHYSAISPNIPFDKNDSFQKIVQNISTVQIESINDTADRIDTAALEEAVGKLIGANRIVVLGMSPNNLLAEIFRRKMATIGKIVEVAPPGEIGIIAYSLTNKDTAIVISYSGNDVSREPMKFIPDMNSKGVKLIGITSDGYNYMRQEIDTVLTISSREGLYKKISNFSTEESILFILNVLYACFFSTEYIKHYTYKLKNSIKLEESRRIRQMDLKE